MSSNSKTGIFLGVEDTVVENKNNLFPHEADLLIREADKPSALVTYSVTWAGSPALAIMLIDNSELGFVIMYYIHYVL